LPDRPSAPTPHLSLHDALPICEVFARGGIKVEGQVIVTPKDSRADWTPVSQHATPLNILVYVINKKSQNHYAEQVVKMLGAEVKDRKSTRLNSSHDQISYAVFC